MIISAFTEAAQSVFILGHLLMQNSMQRQNMLLHITYNRGHNGNIPGTSVGLSEPVGVTKPNKKPFKQVTYLRLHLIWQRPTSRRFPTLEPPPGVRPDPETFCDLYPCVPVGGIVCLSVVLSASEVMYTVSTRVPPQHANVSFFLRRFVPGARSHEEH